MGGPKYKIWSKSIAFFRMRFAPQYKPFPPLFSPPSTSLPVPPFAVSLRQLRMSNMLIEDCLNFFEMFVQFRHSV